MSAITTPPPPSDPTPPAPLPAKGSPEELERAIMELTSPVAQERIAGLRIVRSFPRDVIKAAHMRVRPPASGLVDPFQQARVYLPTRPVQAEVIYATVVGPGFLPLLQMHIDSFHRYAQAGPNVRLVVFGVDEAYHELKHRRDITAVRCESLCRISPAIKSVLWTLPTVFPHAKVLVSVEADMLFAGPVKGIVQAVRASAPGVIHGVEGQFTYPGEPRNAETNTHLTPHIDLEWFMSHTTGYADDVYFITGERDRHPGKHMFNGGLFAGTPLAFQRVRDALNSYWPFSQQWVEGAGPFHFYDETVTLMTIGLMGNYHTLHARYNHQIFGGPNEERYWGKREYGNGYRFISDGQPSAIMHFVGDTRPDVGDRRPLMRRTWELMQSSPLNQ